MRFNLFTLCLTLGILTQSCSIINAAIPVLLRPTSPPASSLPVVRDVLPSSGPVGTRVTISGANLGSVVSVSFGDQSTLPVSRNATTVVVIVPEGATSGRITVNTPTESAKSQTIFTVTASPTVDEVFPRSGPVGTNVTITGQNLENARSVQFGGVSAPIVAKFPTQIIARVPSGAQSGPIIVLSDGPAARSRESFEVTQPARAPVISDFTPQSGRAGASITIFGADLNGVREVRFGSVATTNFVVVSSTVLRVVVPSGVAPGPVKVSVVAGAGTAQSEADFIVVAPAPSVFSISGRLVNSAGLGVVGARVTRTGSRGTATVLTDAAGNYTFTNVAAGTYTLTSELAGAIFSPASRVVTVGAQSLSNVNFSAAAVVQKFRLGGRVTLRGAGLAGVTITRSREGVILDATISDAAGNYSFANALAGAYTLSAAKSGFSFVPASRTVNVSANRSDQNFAASAIVAAPANDQFTRARVLSGASGRSTANATGATSERGEPAHAGNAASASIWFRWTAPGNGLVTFDTFGSSYDTTLAIYTGTTVSTLRAVTANDDADTATSNSRVAFNATRGVTYQVAVDGLSNGAANIVLNWRLATLSTAPTPTPAGPPRNDNLANAQVIAGSSGRVIGTNVNATSGTDDDFGTGERTVWYRWTAPANGSVTFSTAGSTFDTILAVYSGTAQSGFERVVSNDDALGVGTSEVRFSVTRGVIYSLSVGGFRGAQGTIALSWTFRAAPGNDNFAAAKGLSGPSGRVTDSNLNATREPGEPNIAGSAPLYSLWYSYKTSTPGRISFSTAGSNFDTRLAVYRRANTGALVDVTSDSNGSQNSRVTFDAQAGTTYYLAVDGFINEAGNIVLTWSTNYTLRVRLTTTETRVSGVGVTLRGQFGTRTASTDVNGLAVFDDLPVGTYLVSPGNPSSTTGVSPASRTVEVKKDTEVSFAILGPFSISGKLVDDKGAPVDGEYVYLFRNAVALTYVATDAQGRYAFEDRIAPGTYTLSVDEGSLGNADAKPTSRTVTVTNSDVANVNFTILGPFTISGTLLDDKGAPVDGEYVYLFRDGVALTYVGTDAQGRYAFVDRVPPGTYTVSVDEGSLGNADAEPSSRTVTLTNSDATNVNFTILGPFSISGTLADDKGTSVDGEYVYLFRNGVALTYVATDAQGRYTFVDRVPPGTYTVSVDEGSLGNADAEPSSQTVIVTRSDVENVNFTILGPFTISGRVTDAAGSGRSGIYLTLKTAEGYTVTSAATDEIGKYQITDRVAPGTYTLFIDPPSGTTADPVSRTIVVTRSDVTDANFTIQPNAAGGNTTQSTLSSVALSTAAANAKRVTIALTFAGALNAKDAVSANCFRVAINGRITAIESASVASSGRVVTLQLPQSTLDAGDKVTVSWVGLRDAKGRRLRDQSTLVTAR